MRSRPSLPCAVERASQRWWVTHAREAWGGRTVGCAEERRVVPVDAEANREDGENVEEHDAHEGRANGARDGTVRLCRLARGERDELDAAIGVEGVSEGLRERGEAADDGLAVVEVCQALGTGESYQRAY